MAGPQGRDPRRCSARGHMIMCGESAARASRVPSPVQACTGRRVAVVGACRGVAPFEFMCVHATVAFYSCYNTHRDLLRQRRRGKLQFLLHAFASEHAPGSSHAVDCYRVAFRFRSPAAGARVLFAVPRPLCALASALSAVAAVAHALVPSVTAVSPRSALRIRWPVDFLITAILSC